MERKEPRKRNMNEISGLKKKRGGAFCVGAKEQTGVNSRKKGIYVRLGASLRGV